MTLDILLLILGFALLLKGAAWLVDGASMLAKKKRISDLTIGLTVVAFGTSSPELVVNLFAASQSHHDIVFGNIIGSSNFNLFMILGISGMVAPLAVQRSTIFKEIPLSLLAVSMMFVLTTPWLVSQNIILTRLDGIILLLFFSGFLYYIFKQIQSKPTSQKEELQILKSNRIWLMIIFGLGGLVAGGQLVVSNAVDLATLLGVSQKIIGLTIVAVGTSLPELATSVVAVLRKNDDLAVGNIIGSNIFNIFLILGLSALVNPIEYSRAFDIDMLLLAGGTILLFAFMFIGRKHKLDRWQAFILAAIYVVYTVFLILNR